MRSRGSDTAQNSGSGFLILVILLGIAFLIYKYRSKMTIIKHQNIAYKGVYSGLKLAGFTDPIAKYITAQAAFETANFTSQIYIENQNAFGMKYAGQRLSIGEKNGYAEYKDVKTSIDDFSVWYSKKRVLSISLIFTLEQYVDFLKKNDYFEVDKDVYLAGCQRYLKEIFNE